MIIPSHSTGHARQKKDKKIIEKTLKKHLTFEGSAIIFVISLFLGSSMVEHAAVNRRVASSSLARGAESAAA